jgi:hypothetical protein
MAQLMTAQALKLDYYQIYDVANKQADSGVFVRGQFDKRPLPLQVSLLDYIASPTSKNGEAIFDRAAYLAWYLGVQPAEPNREVVLKNQFGSIAVRIGRGYGILAPAVSPRRQTVSATLRDHYKVYAVREASARKPVTLTLRDEWGTAQFKLGRPRYLAVPVTKRHLKRLYFIHNETSHLLLYELRPELLERGLTLTSQFSRRITITLLRRVMLGVPSLKLKWAVE